MTIPLTKPGFGAAEEQAVIEVLRSGRVVQGPKVAQFEAAVAAPADAKHAVATSSCTTALQRPRGALLGDHPLAERADPGSHRRDR
jgi:dTDP-4-amino-4,6-dideoxygalactose transaminase